jgi:hypothetical protein
MSLLYIKFEELVWRKTLSILIWVFDIFAPLSNSVMSIFINVRRDSN